VRVFITGGTGYVGQRIALQCQTAGHDVVVLSRPNTTRPISMSGIEVVHGDIFDKDSLQRAMSGADAVIHLVGIIRAIPSRGITMDSIHHMGTAAVVETAKNKGVQRFVHMSALGARADAVSSYHISKWRGEERVRASGLPYTIFRPSVIFGRGGAGPEFVGQLANLVKSAPLIPVLGDGQYFLQPVSIETIAHAFCAALTNDVSVDKTYEVGGPNVLSYLDILKKIAASLHKPFRPIHIPMGLMKRMIPILQRIPSFPLTKDQLTMLQEGNVCHDTVTVYQDFDLPPIQFEVTL